MSAVNRTPGEVIFEAVSVSKSYPRRASNSALDSEGLIALQEINLHVRQGEFVCIVGPSGCGKSTFLNLVAGFDHPTQGELRLDGRAITKPDADRGMVFQEHALFPWLTVKQNASFGPSVAHVPKTKYEPRVDEYLSLVGMQKFADMYPDQLSGGMRQRAAIARALVNDPEILLMDEPFGALDLLTRGTMQRELARIWGETRKTVIFVTHSIDEAVLLGDRVIVFSAHPGRIREVVDIGLPHPRDLLCSQAVELKRRISSLLSDQISDDVTADNS